MVVLWFLVLGSRKPVFPQSSSHTFAGATREAQDLRQRGWKTLNMGLWCFLPENSTLRNISELSMVAPNPTTIIHKISPKNDLNATWYAPLITRFSLATQIRSVISQLLSNKPDIYDWDIRKLEGANLQVSQPKKLNGFLGLTSLHMGSNPRPHLNKHVEWFIY